MFLRALMVVGEIIVFMRDWNFALPGRFWRFLGRQPVEGAAAGRRLALMLSLARPEGASSGAADTISSVNSFLGEKETVANLPRCGPVCPV